jgi:hypothetical protein
VNVANPPSTREIEKEGSDVQNPLERNKKKGADTETIAMKVHESDGQQNSCSSLAFELRAGIEDNQNPTILFGTNEWRGNISITCLFLGT